MKIVKRILFGLLIFIVVIVIIGFSLFRYLSTRAVPDYSEDISLSGLLAPVEVFRDSFAIPHVFASNEHDLYMVIGYLMAQDRLWQMDMLRHVTEGRLSEIFGRNYADADLLLRALRFRKKSDLILQECDSAELLVLNAFSEGINQYISKNSKRLPPEFSVLKYKPEKWEPWHTLNMIGYMAWDLKAGWSELLLSDIRKTVDSIRYNQIIPDLTQPGPTVYPLDKTGTFSTILPDKLLDLAMLQKLGIDVLDGSNNWAVTGSHSATGKPLLANDMHLGLSVPGIWYQMHQVIPGRLNVTGLVLPGAPVVICGHNDSIAWGMTNTFVDNLDFYEETVNPDDSGQYEYNGEWKKFEEVSSIIKTSDGKQIERKLRFSHRGPVVSSFKKIPGNVVTMHWVGDEKSHEFRTILKLNKAHNWDEFKNALTTFTSLSQNIVYADVNGNIGLFCAAGIPIRNRDIPFGILPGNTDKYDWKGYVPFDELPYSFNPPNGFVVSANNRTVPVHYPYHIGTWYPQPYRYNRITEMLTEKDILSPLDFRRMQLDVHSELARKFLPACLNVLDSVPGLSPVEKKALNLLSEWDYSMDDKSAAAAVFEKMYLQFIKCTFGDELGEQLFSDFNGVTSVSREATDKLIDQKISPWFDNTGTPAKEEDFGDMILCAFSRAVEQLTEQSGEEPGSWQWGNYHRLILAHPLSAVNVLERAFDLNPDPVPVGGSFHTVSCYSYNSNKPFSTNYGPSHRHIFDVSNWDNSLTVIPTGNSGIPASPHYCDQTGLFVSGRYHTDYFSRDKIVANARYHMVFNVMKK